MRVLLDLIERVGICDGLVEEVPSVLDKEVSIVLHEEGVGLHAWDDQGLVEPVDATACEDEFLLCSHEKIKEVRVFASGVGDFMVEFC